MAVIKFINRKNLTIRGMKKNINYITKDEKTDGGKYVYGHNCDVANVYEDFYITKQTFGKMTGRQHIHFTQSFQGQEARAELAHQVGKELLGHPLFESFQVVMATHTDTHNIHNHFVINTVNIEDGKKWHISENDMEELKDFSNEICAKYSLKVIDKTNQTPKEYTSIGEGSKKKEMVTAVLAASWQAKSADEFSAILKADGRRVHWNADEYFQKNERLEAILNACKYHAKDESEFIRDCEYYGVKTTWKVKAITTTETDGEKKQEEKVFTNNAEHRAELERIKEEESLFQVVDEIFYEYEGKTYTPAHFYKNLRWDGNSLRAAFQVNLIKDKKKPLPSKEELKSVKSSNEYKDLNKLVRIARQCSLNQKDFVDKMQQFGITVTWNPQRKYITFQMPSGKKYRNNRFFPPSSYTKEAFFEVFAFNEKMRKLILDYKINSYDELKALAVSGRLSDCRLEKRTNRVYLKINISQIENAEKEAEKNWRESYFDEKAIRRFLADEARQDILLPEKAEILKEDKKPFLLLESKEGYLFSAVSLSKKFTQENLKQRFFNNAFQENKPEVERDIRTVMWLSRSWQDFAEKLKAAGYDLRVRALTEDDRGNCVMAEEKPVSDEKIAIFIAKNGIPVDGRYLSKSFTIKEIAKQLEENQQRISAGESKDKFNLFLQGLYFVSDKNVNGESAVEKTLIKKKLEGQALKDYLKEKGYEL